MIYNLCINWDHSQYFGWKLHPYKISLKISPKTKYILPFSWCRECREFYWNRRRRSSGRQHEDIIEESSEESDDDQIATNDRDKRPHKLSSTSDNFRKTWMNVMIRACPFWTLISYWLILTYCCPEKDLLKRLFTPTNIGLFQYISIDVFQKIT